MYKNSLKILVSSVALILSFSSTVNALTKAEKIDECLYGSLSDEEINSLITEIDEWKSIYKRSLRMNTALCFTKLTGAPADHRRTFYARHSELHSNSGNNLCLDN